VARQIRRAYRNLVTREHPDKGGDADKFKAIQKAYDVLSADDKVRCLVIVCRTTLAASLQFLAV
jgi:preprotein translocase subunit Sec63